MLSPTAGCTIRHEGHDLPVEQGFVLLRFAAWRANVAGVDLAFWAESESGTDAVGAALKDESSEVGLDASLFNGNFKENVFCGTVSSASLRLCEVLAEDETFRAAGYVLELGAGSGLPGLWAASRGSQIVLSDRHAATLDLLDRS